MGAPSSFFVMDAATHPLDVRRVRAGVRGVIGSILKYVPEVDSTNRVLRDLPLPDWSTGLAVLTDHQTAGRGRRGRTWTAPGGTSVLMSVLLELPPPAFPVDASMLAALAAGDATVAVTGLEVFTKWPNDLLIRGRKFCGILAEHVVRAGRHWTIVGLGMNVNLDRDDLTRVAPGATSLLAELEHPVDRERLLLGVFEQFDLWYGCLTREPNGVFGAWSARLGMIGSDVVVRDATGEWRGVATGVGRDGSLLVDTGGAMRTVHAGDVSIRAPGGFTTG